MAHPNLLLPTQFCQQHHNSYRRKNTLRNMQGATLISLMIGMLISIFSVIIILALYKNLILISVGATTDASHDGQVASAMVTTQLELQTAGFGIPNAGALHLNTNDNGTEIRWRYLDQNQYFCRAIRETAIDTKTRSLQLLEATNNCDDATVLTGLVWTPLATLTKIQRTEEMPEQIFKFSITTKECSPFGIGAKEKHFSVSLSALGSADFHSNTSDISATEFEICLVGTHPA